MKIAFDMSQAICGTGVFHYLVSLVKKLLEIDKNNNYLLYSTVLRRRKDMEAIIASFSAGYGKL